MYHKIVIFLLFSLSLTAQKVPHNHIRADSTAYYYLGITHDSISQWMPSDSLGLGGVTPLTQEEVEDFAFDVTRHGSGTQTLIGVTYDDANNNVDYIVENDLSLYDNSTSAFTTGSHVTISDAAYGVGWNGNTTDGASKNAIYDHLSTIISGLWSPQSSDIYFNTGFVGIGLAFPTYRLHLYENSSSTKFPLMLENNGSGSMFMRYVNSTRDLSVGLKTNDYEIYDNTIGRQHFLIESDGDVFFSVYDNTRDNSSVSEPDNVLYVNWQGQVMVKPEPISYTTMTATSSTDEWNNVAWTELDLQTNSYDEGSATSGNTATNRITVSKTGSYTITASLQGGSTGTDVAIEMDIWIGNSQLGTGQICYISGANSIDVGSASISYTRRVTAGSYFRVLARRVGSNATSVKRESGTKLVLTVTRIRITN